MWHDSRMNPPAVSIIVPVFNVEPYITDCLQSVMRQTYQGPMECILVDDCGTDRSMAIAEQLIANYTGPIGFKTLRHEHNRGLSAARNTGTNAATGDYVYYLDSDDYISNDCLEVLARPLQEKEYDMVVGDFVTFGGESNVRLWVEQGGEYKGERLRKACYSREIYVMAWNKLCNLRFLRQHELSFYEGILHEDELWSYRMAKCFGLVYVEKKCTMYYRLRSQGIIGQIHENHKKAADSLYTIVKQIVEQESVEDDGYVPERMTYINSLFQKYLMCDFGNKVRMKRLYLYVRSHWNYAPLKLYRAGLVPFSQVKTHLYFVLPPALGWRYLYLRTWKNYGNNR